MRRLLTITLLAFVSTFAFAQKWENLADTPQMGFNTWNKFACNIDESIIIGIADAMVETGLRDCGYIYLNIDDCWHGERDSNGFMQCDKERFPHGIKWLADYVHSKGLKIGIYSDAGTKTCGGRPGSLGHEYQDALQYALWGIDYLKYDWCFTEDINAKGAYRLMRDALRAAGRPIFFSMCEWGTAKPWEWAADIGHSWRTGPDIWCNFDKKLVHDTWTQYSVMDCVRIAENLRKYAGKGHWNDPDMLEVGNGMSDAEDRSHFTLWCMMASPLIIGNDIRSMRKETAEILMNKEMIAVDQDTLGVQGLHLSSKDSLEFWFKPLSGGDWAFTILNTSKEDKVYPINWQGFNFTDEEVSGRSTEFDNKVYAIRNLWKHEDEGFTSKEDKVSKTVVIPSHDVVSYRLSPR